MEKIDYTKCLKNDVKGLKIAVPKEFFGEGINKEVKEKLEKAIEKYKELGAVVEEVSLDIANYALATYYIIACAEASSNLGRFDGIRYGYRSEKHENLKDIYINSRSEGFGEEQKKEKKKKCCRGKNVKEKNINYRRQYAIAIQKQKKIKYTVFI